jgi:dienelactone hydrolase
MSTGACPDCFTGTISTNTPIGTIATIHDLPTYVTSPDDGVKPKGLVVFICDAFGYTLSNNQVLADQYAKKGQFLVYVPDLMRGKSPNTCITSLSTKELRLMLQTQGTQWTHPLCS